MRHFKAWLEADISKPKQIEPSKRDGPADDSATTVPRKSDRIKVRIHRKSSGEFSELHMKQEIKAHAGAILTMKFSLDGRLLATGGKDSVVHVWEVLEQSFVSDETERSDSSERTSCSPSAGFEETRKPSSMERSPSGTGPRSPKSFKLSEKAAHSFYGHTEDVLDLSWSPSQFLLSSSRDKTVRLWHVSSGDCLRVFTHNDYVTCIHFNPVDEKYFISGSLDDKVRIWSIPDYHVVDWTDMRAMVTAACYTPDGKGAIVGSYKGTCRYYQTSGNKLQFQHQFEVCENKKKKGYGRKICGVQCMPGDPAKVLITSNDSRVRLFDGTDLCCKFKGIRNTTGQTSASFSASAHYVICASEDSRVYIWNVPSTQPTATGNRHTDPSCEDFPSRDVSVAIPWPGSSRQSFTEVPTVPLPADLSGSGEQPMKNGSRTASPWRCASQDNGDSQEATFPSRQLQRSSGGRRPFGVESDGGDHRYQRVHESHGMWSSEGQHSVIAAAKDEHVGGGYDNLSSLDYEDDCPSSDNDAGDDDDNYRECPETAGSPSQVVAGESVADGTCRPSLDSSSDLSLKSVSRVTSPLEPYLAFQTSSIANSSSQNSFSSVDIREECGSAGPGSQFSQVEKHPVRLSASGLGSSNTSPCLKPVSITANGSGSPLMSSNSSSSLDLTAGSGITTSKATSVSPSTGLVIVTAGLGGEIRTFQNYGHVKMV